MTWPEEDAESVARRRRKRKMFGLWRHRFDRGVAPALMAWAWHDDFWTRYQAVILLGQLEHAPARVPLRRMLSEVHKGPPEKNYGDHENRRTALQILLARIENRHLTGRNKLDAVAASIGRSFDDLLEREYCSDLHSTHVSEIIQMEFFEMLLSMARAGEDVTPWFKQVWMWKAERFQIEGAHLPPGEQVTRILDHFCALDIGDYGDARLATYHLPRLGTRAPDLLLARLQAMAADWDKYFRLIDPLPYHIELAEKAEREGKTHASYLKKPRYNNGYIELFRAARATGEARFIPMLREFERIPASGRDGSVQHYAQQSRHYLQRDLGLPVKLFE